MGCRKITYHEQEPLSENWKIFVDGIEKNASGSKICKDYYAGGSIMPGRNSNPGSYRYGGAGGQESDAEITGSFGNHYTAEHWMYDSRLMRRWNVDPVDKPWESSYATFSNNPVYFVDPSGANPDNYLIKSDGNIEVERTDDKTDNFKYQGSDGTVTDLGTFSKNGNGLIGLPSSHNQGGAQFTYTGSTGENYISGEAMAGLLGALKSTGITDLRLNHWSNSDGTSPSPSSSHKDGTVGDLRPLRKDKSGSPVLVSNSQFDKTRNSTLITAFKKFGWTSVLSEKSGGYITPGTTHYNKSRHNNHFHIQKYKPKLTVVSELSIGSFEQSKNHSATKTPAIITNSSGSSGFSGSSWFSLPDFNISWGGFIR